MTSPRPTPTIALVAVPGAGTQRPGAAARAVGDLLLRLHGARGSRYSSFVERAVRIPTRPARVNTRSAPNVAPDLRGSIFAEQHAFLRTQLQYGGAAARDREEDSPDHQLMRAQLAEYRSSADPYDTVRLEGERLTESADNGAPDVDARLHVYEVRWADVSRLASGALRFPAELYQLFLHLTHLGQTALDHARLEHPGSTLWRTYGVAHTWAVRLLTVFVPAVFAAMLTTVAAAAMLGLPAGVKPYVLAGAAVLLAGAFVSASGYRSRLGRTLALWLRISIAVSLTALGLAAGARGPLQRGAGSVIADDLLVDRLVLGAWILAAGGIVYVVFRAYERLRPGALTAGLGAYVVLAATPVAFVATGARGGGELLDGTIHVFEAEAVVAAGVWGAIYLLGILAGTLGLTACWRLDGPARDRAWRAARTAAATLAVATASVLVATFGFWSAMYRAVDGMLPARPFVATIPSFHRPGQTYGDFFERALEVTAGAGLPLMLLVAAALATAGALVLVPILLDEIRSPRSGETSGGVFDERATATPVPRRDAPIDTDVLWAAWERSRREGDASQRLGEWLTRGFRVLGVAVVLLYVTVFVLAPAISVVHLLTAAPALDALQSSAGTVLLAAGGGLAAAAAALVLLRGPFAPLTFGFRSAIDVALGVDDYLRTHPRESTPRARIAERYTSLLRYLCQWRDSSGRPYDAIVIVAHSLGAAITTDLLTFIQREEDPELEPLRRPLADGVQVPGGRRLFLFTTGSPSRQFYSEWFPHLFGWVRGETGDGVSRPLPAVPREPWMLLPRLEQGHRVFAPAIPDAAPPDPFAMGITRWVNVYRSGDYVGRALWRHALDARDWIYRPAPPDAATRFVGDVPPITYVSEDAHRSRRELCIGAGAHTHYWDASARPVAVELDLLVADAAKMAARVARDSAAPTEGMES